MAGTISLCTTIHHSLFVVLIIIHYCSNGPRDLFKAFLGFTSHTVNIFVVKNTTFSSVTFPASKRAAIFAGIFSTEKISKIQLNWKIQYFYPFKLQYFLLFKSVYSTMKWADFAGIFGTEYFSEYSCPFTVQNTEKTSIFHHKYVNSMVLT